MQNFNAIIELLVMLVMDLRTASLFVLLIIASVIDCRIYRIPNVLTVSGTIFGLVLSVVAPFSVQHGLLWALCGVLIGFLCTLPLYALKVMGAGDVKLMAMVGAFIGFSDMLTVVLSTFVVGGFAAIGFALFRGTLGRMLSNVKSMVHMMMLSAIDGAGPDMTIANSKSAGKIPYGLSICIGTVASVVAKQLGYW